MPDTVLGTWDSSVTKTDWSLYLLEFICSYDKCSWMQRFPVPLCTRCGERQFSGWALQLRLLLTCTFPRVAASGISNLRPALCFSSSPLKSVYPLTLFSRGTCPSYLQCLSFPSFGNTKQRPSFLTWFCWSQLKLMYPYFTPQMWLSLPFSLSWKIYVLFYSFIIILGSRLTFNLPCLTNQPENLLQHNHP